MVMGYPLFLVLICLVSCNVQSKRSEHPKLPCMYSLRFDAKEEFWAYKKKHFSKATILHQDCLWLSRSTGKDLQRNHVRGKKKKGSNSFKSYLRTGRFTLQNIGWPFSTQKVRNISYWICPPCLRIVDTRLSVNKPS